MTISKTPTKDMGMEAWRAERKKGIGGSDAAAIVGLNSWSTPYSVWAEKTGQLPEKEETEAMRQGRDFEDYVARRWTEATGKKVKRVNAILHNDAYPFALANIDRWVVGENAGLECKTTSIMNLKNFKGGEFPASYYTQCVHYMAVTGADRWYLAVLVLNQGFYEFVIEREEDEIAALMAAEAEFWKLVESDTPPAPDGLDPTGEAIETIYADDGGGAIDLFGRDKLLDEYNQLQADIKELETRKDTIKQTIQLDLGDHDTGVCGSYKVTWRNQSRTSFDHKDYAANHPEADLSDYYKTTVSRVFKVTRQKGA